MRLEGILGGLHALLGLEPDETELVLNVVDHDGLTLTTTFLSLLGRGVGTLELDILVLALHVLLAVALPQDTVLLDVEGVGENLVSGDKVLHSQASLVSEHSIQHLPSLISQRGALSFPLHHHQHKKINVQCR